MAVQKKKCSRNRRGCRRSHDYLKLPNLYINKCNKLISLYHHMDDNGFYRGKKIKN